MNKKGLLILLSVVALSYCSEQCCANTCESTEGNAGYLHTARGCYRNDICCTSNRWGGIFTADLLIWQAKIDGLEFAAKNSIFQTQGLNINASNIYPDFDWRPGVKVGLGLYIPCDWDFYSNFTYFYTNSKTSTSAETSIFGFGLIPLIRHPANVPTTPLRFGSASSQWKMDFYTLDFELGYAMIVSKYLDLRLHGGLKGAIINQEYTVQYRNGQTIGDIQVKYGNEPLPIKFIEKDNKIMVNAAGLHDGTYDFDVQVEDNAGNTTSASIKAAVAGLPTLSQVTAFPNPAKVSSSIRVTFSGAIAANASVKIYDTSGHKVTSLSLPNTSAGIYEGRWNLDNSDGEKVANGVYFAEVKIQQGSSSYKMRSKIAVLR